MELKKRNLELQPVILDTDMNQLRDIVSQCFSHAIAFMVLHGMNTQFKFVSYHFTAKSDQLVPAH